MTIPNTTVDNPYIKFAFDKKGKIKLFATSSWWGGKNSGFTSTDGTEGNSCEPNQLKAYIKAFKERKIKDIEKEISALQKQLQVVKSKMDHSDF